MTLCSAQVLVIEELNWDCFRFDGTIILPVNTVADVKAFLDDDWEVRAARKLGIAKQTTFLTTKKPFSSIVKDLISKSRLFEIESSQTEQDELLLVECEELKKEKIRVKSYDGKLDHACTLDVYFREITKLTVGDGYCRAAEAALIGSRRGQM